MTTDATARRPLLRLPWATITAVLAGLVTWTAFAPVSFGPSAPVGVALLTASLWQARVRRGAGLGLIFGLAYFIPLLSWMTVIGTDAWLALSLESAAWLMIVGVGTTLATRLPVPTLWITAVWVLSEAIRGRWPWGGFPWGSLGFSQPDTDLSAAAGIGGVASVTAVVVIVGASLTAAAVALSRARYRSALAHGVVLAAAVALPPILLPWATPDAQGMPTTRVAIVQGGTPQTGMGAMDVRRAVLDNHLTQTFELARAVEEGRAERPDFVVWPENSSDLDPFGDPSVAADITAAARAVAAPIIVGAVTEVPDDPSRVWNVAIVWDPEQGPTQMYVKTHPVPFGEYIPFREQLAPLIGRFDRVPRDFAPGDLPGSLQVAGVDMGIVICFEIAYTDVVDASMQAGAELLVVQTNNATYAGTAQPDQQLAIERTQAIGTGRYVLVAATSGISAALDPTGRIVEQMTVGEQGWFQVEVPLVQGLSWGTRIGSLLEGVLAAIAVVGAAWGFIRIRRERVDDDGGGVEASPRVVE